MKEIKVPEREIICEFDRYVLECIVSNAISTVAQTTQQHIDMIVKYAHTVPGGNFNNNMIAELQLGGIRVDTIISMLAQNYQKQEAMSEAEEALYGLGYNVCGPTWNEYIVLWGKPPWRETHSNNLWNIKNEVKNN